MIITESGESLLILQFRDFYRELIALKRISRERTEGGEAEIRQRIVALLDRQLRVAIQFGGSYLAAYEEARYVMVALADETFLHSDWDGRFTWNFQLLETHIYQTHVAGDLFFQRIDQLIPLRDDLKIELARIYLMALALGFQGRFRGADQTGELAAYRGRLYDYVADGRHLLADGTKQLFPEAGEHLLNASPPLLLPPVRRWALRLAILAVIAIGVQQIVWRYFLTPDVRHVVEQILKNNDDTDETP